MFHIGGIYLKEQKELEPLIQMIFKTYKVHYVELFCTVSHTFYSLLNNWQKPKDRHGFVFFNLNLPEFNYLNLMLGAIDVF